MTIRILLPVIRMSKRGEANSLNERETEREVRGVYKGSGKINMGNTRENRCTCVHTIAVCLHAKVFNEAKKTAG